MAPTPTVTHPKKKEGGSVREYRCTNCNRDVGRDNLTVKRVEFCTMGEKFRRLRSRTVAWLCNACREADPAWTAENYYAAPGTKDSPDESPDA